jgi:hypothetical protein
MSMKAIHKSHSRNDLLEIIEIFNLDINDYELLSKDGIRDNIIIALHSVCEVAPNCEYPIMDIDTLIDFLENPSPRKTVSPDEKLKIMKKVKRIIHFVQLCSCDINTSHYETLKAARKDVLYIRKYGDFPSVRRAIRIYNEARLGNKIYPQVSMKVQRRLDIQEEIKQIKAPGLKCETKSIELVFD